MVAETSPIITLESLVDIFIWILNDDPDAHLLVGIDRDGVINENIIYDPEHPKDPINYITCPEEWNAVPESLEAIASLQRAGHVPVVITNQAGRARTFGELRAKYADKGEGFPAKYADKRDEEVYISEETLESIHAKMNRELTAVGGQEMPIYHCPHLRDCECRKPKPTMLRRAGEDSHIPPKRTIMIGDSTSDLQAGLNYGASLLILVQTGQGGRPETHAKCVKKIGEEGGRFLICASLAEASAIILEAIDRARERIRLSLSGTSPE